MKSCLRICMLIMLSIILIFSNFGCDCSNGGSINENNINEEILDATDKNTGGKLYLITNNQSLYKIVIPESATNYERYAAEELQYFIDKSTGIIIDIISDNGLVFDEKTYLISIGHTNLAEKSGMICDKELGEDGYKILTKGNTIILNGYGQYGILYSVYGFLDRQLGYEAYAVDEVFVEAKNEVVLKDFHITDIPQINTRMSGYASTRTSANAKAAGRMQILASELGGQPIFGNGKFCMWVHSTLTHILPYQTYKDRVDSEGYKWIWTSKHPDIPSACGQLCFTNKEMTEEFINNFLKIVDENPDATYFNVSVMDCQGYCDCDRCAASDQINGGPSGTMMIFINKVAEALEQHLIEIESDRNVVIVPLAYHDYEKPPVVENNGTFLPINESVKARNNVMMMIAPIFACKAHGIDDKECDENVQGYKMFYGWSSICDRLAVYDYDTHYRDSFLYLNNFNSIAYNFNLYYKLGVEFVFPLGDINNTRSNFSELKTYLHSKLLWNTEQNLEELVEAFMNGYYKDAGEVMFEYYKAIQSHYDWISMNIDGHKAIEHWFVNYERGDVNINKPAYWPEYKLLNLQSYLTRAYEKIEKSTLLPEQKEILRNRVLTEEVSIRYYLLTMYGKSNYSDEEYERLFNEWKEDCKKAGYSYLSESVTL